MLLKLLVLLTSCRCCWLDFYLWNLWLVWTGLTLQSLLTCLPCLMFLLLSWLRCFGNRVCHGVLQQMAVAISASEYHPFGQRKMVDWNDLVFQMAATHLNFPGFQVYLLDCIAKEHQSVHSNFQVSCDQLAYLLVLLVAAKLLLLDLLAQDANFNIWSSAHSCCFLTSISVDQWLPMIAFSQTPSCDFDCFTAIALGRID